MLFCWVCAPGLSRLNQSIGLGLDLTFFQAPSGSWQNSFPSGCRIEVLIFFLAIGQG